MTKQTIGATNHSKAKKVCAYTAVGTCILAVSLMYMYAMSSQNTNTLAEYPIMARATTPRDLQRLPHTKENLIDTIPDESTTPCGFEILQKFINVSAHFPKEGSWSNTQRGNAIYQPKICKFEYQMSKDLPPTLMEKCATEKGLSKILIFGDSNGKKHHKATIDLLKTSGFSCKTIKQESPPGKKMPDVKYFTRDTNISLADIVSHSRDCSGCTSGKTSCSKPRGTTDRLPLIIEVEYIAMEFFQDTEITTFRKVHSGQCPPAPAQCLVSTTYQQFVFGEYLHNNYPDIILLYGNSHDYRRRSLRQIRVDTTTMLSLIQEYVPKTTKVVWFSRPGENTGRKPEMWKNELFMSNLPVRGMIELINNELFSVLQPEITRADTNVLPFFDLEVLMRAVLSWSIDGVHMHRDWYQHIISYVMQMMCNSNFDFKKQ